MNSPTLLHDRYEIRRELGHGGQARTWLAIDTHTSEQVVIKQLHMALAEDWKAIELFEREGRVLKQLDHPAIPSYLDAFHIEASPDTPSQRFVIVQEFIEGETLRELLERGERFDAEQALTLCHQLLDIFDYLHTRTPCVIHRDIKPANLILRPDGSWSLIDFGAIQAVLLDTSKLGSTIVGTSGYMAPEQFMGQAAPATDLYALGATLVHMLTHTHPADMPLVRMRLHYTPLIEGRLPPHLEALLEGLLEPHVEDRIQSAQQARQQLTLPANVSPPATSRTAPWLPILFALTALILVSAMAALVLAPEETTPSSLTSHVTTTHPPTSRVSPLERTRDAQRKLYDNLTWSLQSKDTRLPSEHFSISERALHTGVLDSFHVGVTLTHDLAGQGIEALRADITLLDHEEKVIKGLSVDVHQGFEPLARAGDPMPFSFKVPANDTLAKVVITLHSPELVPLSDTSNSAAAAPVELFWLTPPEKPCALSASARKDEVAPTYSGSTTQRHTLELEVTNSGECAYQIIELEKRLLDAQGNVVERKRSYLNAAYDPPLEPSQHLLVSLSSHHVTPFVSYTLHVLRADPISRP